MPDCGRQSHKKPLAFKARATWSLPAKSKQTLPPRSFSARGVFTFQPRSSHYASTRAVCRSDFLRMLATPISATISAPARA